MLASRLDSRHCFRRPGDPPWRAVNSRRVRPARGTTSAAKLTQHGVPCQCRLGVWCRRVVRVRATIGAAKRSRPGGGLPGGRLPARRSGPRRCQRRQADPESRSLPTACVRWDAGPSCLSGSRQNRRRQADPQWRCRSLPMASGRRNAGRLIACASIVLAPPAAPPRPANAVCAVDKPSRSATHWRCVSG